MALQLSQSNMSFWLKSFGIENSSLMENGVAVVSVDDVKFESDHSVNKKCISQQPDIE